ncbi:copper chaperone PCu(A)C [Kiloniella sp. b19]|uniref:copper chaperone PCu(A)C n=1 Tax=Kiloniella sp. GXU_MW_B19 TaxID=3141326 RepID=UPI0031DCC737
MTRFLNLKAVTAALGLLVASASLPAFAHDFSAGDLSIKQPWARATIGLVKNGAAFLRIENKGGDADRLVAVESDKADRVELHTHLMADGVMQMRQVEGGIPVNAGETVELKPGGYHIMFLGLKEPLKEGESFPLKLMFEKNGSTTVEVRVQSGTALENTHQHHHDHAN